MKVRIVPVILIMLMLPFSLGKTTLKIKIMNKKLKRKTTIFFLLIIIIFLILSLLFRFTPNGNIIFPEGQLYAENWSSKELNRKLKQTGIERSDEEEINSWPVISKKNISLKSLLFPLFTGRKFKNHREKTKDGYLQLN